MANKQKFLMALRDGINKLSGKDNLIEQYRRAANIIGRALSKAKSEKERAELNAAYKELTQISLVKGGNSDAFVNSFDPYKLGNRKVLKQKIAFAEQVIHRFGLAK